MLRKKNNRLEPEGNKPERFGGALDAQLSDELITEGQLTHFLNGQYVTDAGMFTNIDPDHAIRIKTPTGFVYLPILLYP